MARDVGRAKIGTMPGRGLEPLRIAPPDPKSGASANFATLARGCILRLPTGCARICAKTQESKLKTRQTYALLSTKFKAGFYEAVMR